MTAGLRSKPYVFVSHAKHDKADTPMLREVVTALVEKGFKVWLDDPRALKFSDEEIDTWFEDLRGDRRWEDQIDEALRESACVLICVSAQFCRRYFQDDFKKEGVIFREVSYALTDGKAVACRIDDVEFSAVPPRVSEAQVIDLVSDPGRIRSLVQDVEKVMKRTLERRASGLKSAPARDPFLPFLANRQVQEIKARKRLEQVVERSIRGLIVKAPRNECPDAFIERLQRHTTSTILGDERCSRDLHVTWPGVDHEKAFRGGFEDCLRAALRIRDDQDIRAELRRPRDAPLIVLTVVHFDDWTRRSGKLVRAWADYWRGLVAEGCEAPLLPVLMIVTDAAAPGWTSVPALRNARGLSTRQAWKDLQKLDGDLRKRSAAGGFELELLDVLGPVLHKDADDWRRLHKDQIGGAASQLHSDLGKLFAAMFAGKAGKAGIAMEDWCDRVRPLLNAAS